MADTIKDSSKEQRSNKNLLKQGYSRIGHLLSNDHHAFVVKKSERLASALYVITGFIPADEPARGRLRVCALDLINRSTDKTKLHGAGVEAFGARCVEIGTILQAAHSGGLISEMNARLITDEYSSLASFIRENEERISEQLGAISDALSGIEAPKISIGHNKKSPLRILPIQGKGQDLKTSKRQNDRKDLILNAVKSKGRISIKDVVALVDGYSEKTVQRELLNLVRAGVLIKEGERRWSTYRKA